jgi:dienelactone hydrolase
VPTGSRYEDSGCWSDGCDGTQSGKACTGTRTYLVDQGIADPKLVAIGGGSHGGTATNYAFTKYPDLWVAALSLFGVADRATYIQRTNRNSSIRWETKFGGTPEEKPAVYRKADILPDVPKIKTPLLVLWGEEDPQVPPYESFQLVSALKKYDKPSHTTVTRTKATDFRSRSMNRTPFVRRTNSCADTCFRPLARAPRPPTKFRSARSKNLV